MLPGKKTNFLEVTTKTRRHPHQKNLLVLQCEKLSNVVHILTFLALSCSQKFCLARPKGQIFCKLGFLKASHFLEKIRSPEQYLKEFLLFTFLMTTIPLNLFRQIVSSDHFKKLIHQHSLDCLQILQWQYHNALHWQFYSGKILLSIIDAFNFIEFEGKINRLFRTEKDEIDLWPLCFTRIQGTIATGITQPVDVMKTRLMEAKPGQYKVLIDDIFILAVWRFSKYGTRTNSSDSEVRFSSGRERSFDFIADENQPLTGLLAFLRLM